MKHSFEAVITGVGGQGVLVLTQLLGRAALEEGLDVISSEVHGMAQRGGVVTSFLKIGDQVFSPIAVEGSIDAIVSLELAETLRVLRYANASTLLLMNTSSVMPPSTTLGLSRYPTLDDVLIRCKEVVKKVVSLNATKLAEKVGSRRFLNVVMLGALAASKILPVSTRSLKNAIAKVVKSEHVQPNLLAFEEGLKAYKNLYDSDS